MRDDAPVSISKAKLSMPLEDLRSKLHTLIAEGEEIQETLVSNWHDLEAFNAQKDGWRDFCHELLINAFQTHEVADGLLRAIDSRISSGTVQEFTSDGRRSIVRGIGYLQSLEKRLVLVHGLLPNKKLVSATSNSSQDLIEKIQELKTILIDHVTGNLRNESEYRAIRDEIRSYQEISPLLPKTFRDWSDLGSARDYLKRFKHYDERRPFIRGEFQPVISHLESNTAASANPQKFFAAGSHHDAFVEIRNILKNATRELWECLTKIQNISGSGSGSIAGSEMQG